MPSPLTAHQSQLPKENRALLRKENRAQGDVDLTSLVKICVIVFAASFLLFAISPEGRLEDLSVPFGGESVRVARSLTAHGTFADPFAVLKTGPTAHVAPVYPLLYAAVLRFLGDGYAALVVLWALNIAFLSLQMALLPWLSVRLRLGLLPGVFAAALGTLSLHVAVDTHWECFLAGALLLGAFLITDENLSAGKAVLVGVFWGLLILTNPVGVLLLIAWPIVYLARAHENRARLGQRFAILAAMALMTICPWILRDHSQLGAWMFVRDNLGLELYSGNNPCAKATLEENIASGCNAATHPNSGAPVAAELAALGEYRFSQVRLRQAVHWIQAHPREFLALSCGRFRQFWFPSLDSRWEMLSGWGVTLLSLAGIWLLFRENPSAGWLLLLTWVLFPAIYYFVPAEARYRYPIYWSSLLAAGLPLAHLARSVQARIAARRVQSYAAF